MRRRRRESTARPSASSVSTPTIGATTSPTRIVAGDEHADGRRPLGREPHALKNAAGARANARQPIHHAQSRYTRAAVSWKSLARSSAEKPVVRRLNEFQRTV